MHPFAALAVLRFLVLYGSLAACGAFVFGRAVVKRTGASASASRRCANVVLVAAAVALFASLPALAPHTALHSQWGNAWLLRVAGLLGLSLLARRPGAFAGFAPLPILAILASFSISAHALHGGDGRLDIANVIADLVHVAAAAAWLGGIAAFVAVLPLLAVDRAVAAFSPIAVASVVALVLTGTYAAVVHLGKPEALLDNTYGLLVLAKIVLLLPLLALGFCNLLRGNGRLAFDGFSRDMKIETGLLVVIIGLSAILTAIAPPAAAMPGAKSSAQMKLDARVAG